MKVFNSLGDFNRENSKFNVENHIMSASNSHSNEGMPKDTGDSGLPDSTTR